MRDCWHVMLDVVEQVVIELAKRPLPSDPLLIAGSERRLRIKGEAHL